MGYFNPNSVFTFSGSNLNFVEAVKFGELLVEDLYYMSDTGISGTVPIGAYTNDVSFITSLYPDGAFVDSPFIILRQSDQLSVGHLPTISGNVGDIMTVTGANFYQITDVNFGETPASFSMVDSGTLEVVIPSNPDYSSITVYSSLRTGIDDDKTIASGLSPDEFVPIPNVSGVSDLQPTSGTTLSITGDSLSGVSGLNFTLLSEDVPVEASGSNFIDFEVPSGNIRGVPNFMLYSGGVSAFPDSFSLSPLASVTGVGPAVQTGAHFYISGDNFSTGILYKTGDNYLASVMGQTGEFALLSDKIMSGQVPTGIPLFTSGGNVAVGPTISSGVVSLFSDNYPETHPSEVYFTPSIGLPRITSITPSSGIVGDTVSIKGNDLYAITGVNFLPSTSANVGIGTYDAGTIAEITPGFELGFEIGNAATLGSLGEYYDVVLSGFYGAVTGVSGFFSLGIPSITSTTPSTNVVPGATGLIEGTRLYSGASVELYTGETTVGSFQPYLILPSSGYTDNYDQIKFNYPDSFPTGLNYRMIVRNRRSFDGITDSNLGVFKTPYLSGFEPISGDYGDTITVSGYFENLHTSGLTIGDVTALEYTQPATTGFNFVIPSNTSTDTITISTSGGTVSSTGFLSVFPSKPTISGYYSGTIAPDLIDYNQVFVAGNRITVSGDGMNLVTGVKFSGESGSFDFNSFTSQTYSNLGFDVPGGINGVSGQFQLVDFMGRTTDSDSTGINLISVSGFDNFLLPAETVNMTGYNISGMDFLFVSPTGGYVKTTAHSTSLLSDGAYAVETQVPTGIMQGNMRLTGRANAISINSFYPIGVIAGIDGLTSSGTVAVGENVTITGINSFDPNMASLGNVSGSGVALLSLSGAYAPVYPDSWMTYDSNKEVLPFPIDSYSTGTATIGGVSDTFYTQIVKKFEHTDIISGKILITDPWWKQSALLGEFPFGSGALGENFVYTPTNGIASTTYSTFRVPKGSGEFFVGEKRAFQIVDKKISYYDSPFRVTGDTFYVTGFSPVNVGPGQTLTLSGKYLDRISNYTFEGGVDDGKYTKSVSATYITGDSNSVQVRVPTTTELRGAASISLEGSGVSSYANHTGLNSIYATARTSEDDPLLTQINVLLGGKGVDYEVIPTGFLEPEAAIGSTTNYTIEEVVNGTVFIVTKTKFPDGTTMVVSSIPKP